MSRCPINPAARHRLLPVGLAVVLLALLCGLPARAEYDGPNGWTRPKSIIVVTDDNYPPYIFRNAEGQVRGILVDQWKAWEKATGVRVDLQAMDWGQAQKVMLAGKADVIDTIFYNEARAKIYDFTKPYANLDVPVYFHKTLGGISDVQSLRGFTVGVKAGDAVIDVLNRYGIHSLKEYDSYEDIIKAARMGDIRVFSIDAPPALYFIYKYDLEEDFRQAFVLYSGAFHRAVKKGNAGLLELVEQGFAAIAPSEMKDIEVKWLGAPIASRHNLRLLGTVVAAVAALALVMACFIFILRRRVQAKTAELAATLARLRESEERFRAIFNSVSDFIFIHDMVDLTIVDVNQSTCDTYGYAREEMRRMSMQALSAGVAPYTQFEAERYMVQAMSGQPQRFEWLAKARNGRLFWVEANVRMARLGGREHLLLSARDIDERKRAEEALQASENTLRSLFSSMTDVILILDAQGRYLEIAPTQSDRLYRPPADLLGRTVTEVFPPEQAEYFLGVIRRVLESGTTVSTDYHMDIAGRTVWFAGNVSPLSADRVLWVARDITERKRAEEALLQSRERLQLALDAANDGLWDWRLDTGEAYFSPRYYTMLGYEPGEFPADYESFSRLLHPDDHALINAAITTSLRDTETNAFEIRMRAKSGEWKWILTRSRVVDRDDLGAPTRLAGTHTDITERRRAEEAIKENVVFLQSLERVERAIRKTPDMELMLSEALGVILELLDVDRAWLLYPCDLEAPSWSVPVMRTRPEYAEVLRPDQAVAMDEVGQAVFRACLGTETPVHFGPGGDMPLDADIQRLFSVQSQLLLALHPKLGRPWILGLHQCTQDRRWTERERTLFKAMGGRIQDALNSLLFLRDLRASEERYRSLFEKAVEGIFQTGLDGAIIEVNPALAHFYGYDSPAQFKAELKDTSGLYVDLKDRERWRDLLLEHGQVSNYEVQLRRRDGVVVWSSSSARLIKNDKGDPLYFSGSVLDITERKRAELALRESEERYRTLFEQSLDAIAIHEGLPPVFTWVNQAFCDLFGYAPEEVYAFTTEDIWRLVHPDDRDMVRMSLTDRMVGRQEHVRYGFRIVRKDGAVRWVEVTGRRMKHGDRPMNLSIYRDTTERKRAEEALTHAKDAADAANRAKSEFLANMSHEIRTPLNGIVGMIQLLNDSPLSEEQKRYAEAAMQSSRRLTNLLGDILDLSRIEARKLVLEHKPFVLAEILESVDMLYRLPAEQKGVGLRLRLDPDLPRRLVGDEPRLRQVLFNLVGNAVKFTQSGEISVEVERLDPPSEAQCRVLFVISDTGVGIPVEMLDQTFQMFTQVEGSLSRSHQGAGLGLAIVRHLVSLLGGPSIDVSSEADQGTTFSFVLPFGLAAPGPVQEGPVQEGVVQEAAAASVAPGAFPLAGLRVLLVEDEEINQLALRCGLERQGISVTGARSGEAALALLRQGTFDCVLMDIQMPGMSGLEVTQAIRTSPEFADLADIPVIAITAFAMAGDCERFLAAGMDDYLPKPVSFEALVRLLGRVRHERSARARADQ